MSSIVIFSLHDHDTPMTPTSMTRKALTRGRTDHFAAGVTYFPFPTHSAFLPRCMKFHVSLFHCRPKKISFYDLEL